jgi:tellurite resistance protein TerC
VSTTSLLLLLSFGLKSLKNTNTEYYLGILGYLLGINDLFGVLLINKFYWLPSLVFPNFTAMKMLFTTEKTFEPKKFVYKGLKKVVPISNHIDKEIFS